MSDTILEQIEREVTDITNNDSEDILEQIEREVTEITDE